MIEMNDITNMCENKKLQSMLTLMGLPDSLWTQRADYSTAAVSRHQRSVFLPTY